MRAFILGFIFCAAMVGCAGFSYHYYGMSGVSFEQGMLLGPSVNDDLPFSSCAPNSQSKFPCVVMLTKDFFAFKLDYEDLKAKLKACEKK
jgi:hypothetical protein